MKPVFLLTVLLAGCGDAYEEPVTVCVSGAFSPDQRGAIVAALDEWCTKAGACPPYVLTDPTCTATRAYHYRARYIPAPLDWLGPNGHWDGWNIRIDVRHNPPLDWISFVALHEEGHMLGLPDVPGGKGIMASQPYHLTDDDLRLYAATR